MHAHHTDAEVWLAIIGAVILGWLALAILRWVDSKIRGPAAQESLDEHAEFHAAKTVIARVRIDPLTGEGYSHKLTRVPADIPMSDKPATIIDPIQRKARASGKLNAL